MNNMTKVKGVRQRRGLVHLFHNLGGKGKKWNDRLKEFLQTNPEIKKSLRIYFKRKATTKDQFKVCTLAKWRGDTNRTLELVQVGWDFKFGWTGRGALYPFYTGDEIPFKMEEHMENFFKKPFCKGE